MLLTLLDREHNGFSHQNPSFIGAVLNLKPTSARVYLPPDANCFLSTMAHCLRAKNYVNLMVGSKHPSPVWLTPEEADEVRASWQRRFSVPPKTDTGYSCSTALRAHRCGNLRQPTRA